MTNQQLIDKALQELGYLDDGQTAGATVSADVLAILNSMMAAWSVDDMDLQFPPQDTLGDTSPIPTWAEEGIISNLAVKAATAVQLSVSPELAVKAMNGSDLIAKTLINGKLIGADMSHLPQGQYTQWDITTDQ